VASITIHSKRL